MILRILFGLAAMLTLAVLFGCRCRRYHGPTAPDPDDFRGKGGM